MNNFKGPTLVCLLLLYCSGTMAQSSSKLLYGDRPPQAETGPIQILDAVYGQDQRLCNAHEVVARSCDQQQSCRIDADDQLCGDPYRNVRKDFFVAWDCGDGRRTLTVSEGEKAHIYCLQDNGHHEDNELSPQPPRNWQRGRIYVAQVLYGIETSSCDATNRFVQSCNEKANCNLTINNKLCGDPAQGQRKAAAITYWCNGETQQLQVRENGTATLNCR
jgi:hypothetical protein